MMPKAERLTESVTLYEGDCLDVLPMLEKGSVDAVVTDPPYGIGYDTSNSTQQGIQKFQPIHGDDKEFDPSPWMEFRDVLMWGANNYCSRIPSRVGQWYFWDKVTRNDIGVRIGEGEYAWHKLGTKPRGFRHLWSGAYRASERDERSDHPTQKPVELMRWCLRLMPNATTILDPFAGSGTTAIAAMKEGRRCILIERDPHYCEIIRRRVREADGTAPGTLFAATVAKGLFE